MQNRRSRSRDEQEGDEGEDEDDEVSDDEDESEEPVIGAVPGSPGGDSSAVVSVSEAVQA